MSGPPIDAGGSQFGGVAGSHETTAVAASTGAGAVLYRAVVVEVFNDPVNISALLADDAARASLTKSIKNLIELQNAPRNSIAVRIISGGGDKRSEAKEDNTSGTVEKSGDAEAITPDAAKGHEGAFICYPFFPPHLSMPVKPGEQVWIINETVGGEGAKVGRWVCRIPEPMAVEDPNYTHGDRKSSTNFAVGTVEKAEGAEAEPPAFNNGKDFPVGEDPTGRTLAGESDYEEIVGTSTAYASFTPEAVPRLTKRPGDLVLEGSNNTAIILGEDRGWKKSDLTGSVEASNALKSRSSEASMGTIDIVTGRGRHAPAAGEDPTRTAAYTIQNARGNLETDKSISPIAEGDPDFEYDASRIYVSTDTDADSNFSLEYPKVPTWDANKDQVGAGPDGTDGDPVETPDQSHIVMKSDNIRIIARRQEKDAPFSGVEEINGTIRIIKEGTADAEDGTGRGVIIIEPDGTIMIDGPTVVIGSGELEKGNGEGTQVILGRGATEPLVLGQVLADLLDEFFQEILDFLANTYDTHIHPGAVPMSPPAIPSVADQAFIEFTKGNIQTILSKLGKLK